MVLLGFDGAAELGRPPEPRRRHRLAVLPNQLVRRARRQQPGSSGVGGCGRRARMLHRAPVDAAHGDRGGRGTGVRGAAVSDVGGEEAAAQCHGVAFVIVGAGSVDVRDAELDGATMNCCGKW